MKTHTIRLRRPWQKPVVGVDGVTRIDVPEIRFDEAGDESKAKSTYQYVRRFNRPTGLDSSTRVHLVISGWSGQLVSIRLNGQDLEPGLHSIDADVTDLLEPQNEITIQLTDTADAAASLSGEVSLAIA